MDHVLTAYIKYNHIGTLGEECLDDLNEYKTTEEKELAYCDRMARVLLRAALYLTLIGGGSFDNPIPVIVEEMKSAHNKWA